MELRKAADSVMKDCMGLKKRERVLIIYDHKTFEIAEALFYASLSLTENVKLEKIPIGKHHGEEPPSDVSLEMLRSDVIMIATTISLSHTKARKNASEKGARIASMPGITKDMFLRMIGTDYDKITERTNKIFSYFKHNSRVRVTTKKGTDIEFNVMKNGKIMSTKLYHAKGEFGNLPTGEADHGVIEGSANGTIVVDASMSGIGKLKGDLKIKVEKGFATKIEGKDSKKLKELLDSIKDKRAYNIAELGIGTNDKATITGNVLEDEKVFGTGHIALGSNMSYGGRTDVSLHLDGVFYRPTIIVDDKIIMKHGKLLI